MGKTCWFDAPWPLMHTIIIWNLQGCMYSYRLDQHIFTRMMAKMSHMPFLQELHTTHQEYSTSKKTRLFLKKECERYVH